MEFKGKIKNKDEYSEELQPKFANDLTVKEVTLPMRKRALDTLNRIKKALKEIETSMIMEPKTQNLNQDNRSKFQLTMIKRMIEQHEIQSKCEICSTKILTYNNICQTKNIEKIEELAILRNVLIRIDFLINQISSSLSNQLNKKELVDAIHEVELFEKIF